MRAVNLKYTSTQSGTCIELMYFSNVSSRSRASNVFLTPLFSATMSRTSTTIPWSCSSFNAHIFPKTGVKVSLCWSQTSFTETHDLPQSSATLLFQGYLSPGFNKSPLCEEMSQMEYSPGHQSQSTMKD